jgi:hypothetical protein
MLFYLKHLYMFRVFLAHHQEILYCLVSRSLWQTKVWSCGIVSGSDISWTHIHIYIYILLYDERNHEPKMLY